MEFPVQVFSGGAKLVEGKSQGSFAKSNRLVFLFAVAGALLLFSADRLLGQAQPLITELGFQDIPNYPTGLAVADFNGDGIPDVAVVNEFTSPMSPGISVYLGNGDGTFKPPIHLFPDADLSSATIVAADLNSDGKPDLCVGDQSGNLWVLLGNGDGTFQAPVSSSMGPGSPTAVYMAAGDFNGDGKPDIAATVALQGDPEDGAVLVLLGNGDGTFAAPTTPIPTLSIPQQIAAGKFKQNGNDDIALVASEGLIVLIGDGAGGFGVPIVYAVAPDPKASGLVVPRTLIVADINGDGFPDLVTEGSDLDPIEVFLGNGDGSFSSPLITSLGSGLCCAVPGSMAAADFNGDGKIDLFLGSAGSSPNMLLLGNGDGTFQSPIQVQTGFGTFSNPQAWGTAAVDLNGDNRPDIVFADPNDVGWLVSLLNTAGSVGAAILPASYDFGFQTVGTAAVNTTVTVGNPGASAMTFSNLLVSDAADFSATTTCGSSVASTGSCSITVTFNPQSTGEKTASVTFTSNDPLAAAAAISVTGDAIAPVASTSPSVVQFSYQKVGTTSSPQTAQITNTGIGPLTLGLAIQGDFTQTNNCPATLAQGARCTATITYSPEVPGSEVGRLVITSNALPAQSAIALTGIGYIIGPVFSLSPSSVDFGSQYVGTSSAPAVVTVANTGDAPFNISSVTATAGFVPLSTCGSTVQPSFSCAIGIFFDPASAGSQTGLLTIVDNLPTSQQLIGLSGNGTLITVGASSGSSTAQSVSAGQTATYALTIAPVSGYTGTVSLACNGLTPGYTCSLSQNTVALSGSPTSVTVSVTPSATAASGRGGAPAFGGAGGMVLACPIALIFLGAGIYPRWRRRLLSLGVMAVASVLVNSCGGISAATSTSSQTYVYFLQSQPASSITIETPLTLTVTQ
jgi:hypothetical protein